MPCDSQVVSKPTSVFLPLTLQGSEAIASKLQPITSRKEYDAAVQSGDAVVVDFYAPW